MHILVYCFYMSADGMQTSFETYENIRDVSWLCCFRLHQMLSHHLLGILSCCHFHINYICFVVGYLLAQNYAVTSLKLF